MTTPQEDVQVRERLHVGGAQNRGASTTSNATVSGIPNELAVQWTLDTVLVWLQANNFSKDWQETFRALKLHGAQFLELGSGHGGRGNFGMMHQQVYPQLAQQCTRSGSGWDQAREREEGKRMRRLIRSIVTGKPADLSRMVTSHNRKESATNGLSLPSAGTDAGDSPNVSTISSRHPVILFADKHTSPATDSHQGSRPRLLGRPTLLADKD
jgi:mitogen-activated protein kinase kinase kinase